MRRQIDPRLRFVESAPKPRARGARLRRLHIHPLFLLLFGLVLGSLVVGLRPVVAAWSAPDLQRPAALSDDAPAIVIVSPSGDVTLAGAPIAPGNVAPTLRNWFAEDFDHPVLVCAASATPFAPVADALTSLSAAGFQNHTLVSVSAQAPASSDRCLSAYEAKDAEREQALALLLKGQ